MSDLNRNVRLMVWSFWRSPGVLRKCSMVLAAWLVIGGAQARVAAQEQTRSQFFYVHGESGRPVPKADAQIPEFLAKAVTQAEEELTKRGADGWGALVFAIVSEDGKLLEGTANLHHVDSGRRSGYRPYEFIEDDPIVHVAPHKSVFELESFADGYQTFSRKGVIREGAILIWDDIVMDRIKPGEGVTIQGRIQLERDADPGGIEVCVDRRVAATTDASGRYTLTNLRAGELNIHAFKPGYVGMSSRLTLRKSEKGECELFGYRTKSARVRWAYQPDGSRRFPPGLPGGEGLVSAVGLNRVSFADGFQGVQSRSDFGVIQIRDELKFTIMDGNGKGGPIIERIPKTTFDQLSEAPAIARGQTDARALRPGETYIVFCYDGEHYAKMEVLEILDHSVAGDD